jgi:hypothetical protein
MSKPSSKDRCNHLVNHIAAGYWPKIGWRRDIARFRDQSNNGVINLLEELSRMEEILNSCTEILPNNMPCMLEENRGIAIRARSFIVPYAEDHFLNILRGNRSKEKILRARRETRTTLNHCTIKGKDMSGDAKLLLEVMHKSRAHFL